MRSILRDHVTRALNSPCSHPLPARPSDHGISGHRFPYPDFRDHRIRPRFTLITEIQVWFACRSLGDHVETRARSAVITRSARPIPAAPPGAEVGWGASWRRFRRRGMVSSDEEI